MIRLSISRPTLSVPSGYVGLPPGAHIGGFKRAARLPLIGSWGAINSAKKLGMTNKNTRMASARPGNRLTWNMARRNRRGIMYQGVRCGIAIAMGLVPFSNMPLYSALTDTGYAGQYTHREHLPPGWS